MVDITNMSSASAFPAPFSSTAKVIKRDGTREPISGGKIRARLTDLLNTPVRLDGIEEVHIEQIQAIVMQKAHDGITTVELDELSIQVALSWSLNHPSWDKFAGRIAIDNHQKKTRDYNYMGLTEMLYQNKPQLVTRDYYKFVEKNSNLIDAHIKYDRDFLLNYFGFKTLEKSYLLKLRGANGVDRILERPNHLWMRVSIALHLSDYVGGVCDPKLWFRIMETYDFMSQLYYTQASPTLFNAASTYPQLLSCFLLGSDDSLEGIKGTETDVAKISKRAGGIGVHIHRWRAEGSLIRGTNGRSKGPIPFIKMYESTTSAFDQGGDKRKGSAAIYLDASHPQFLQFIEMRKTHGDPATRAPHIFLGGWIPDLLMMRVALDEQWSFFDPEISRQFIESNSHQFIESNSRQFIETTIETKKQTCLGELNDSDYERVYTAMEEKHMQTKVQYGKDMRRSIRAVDLLKEIAVAQIESGFPYMLYKDPVNRRSNQKHYGPIHSSNLCTEILEYSDANEYACCTLASIGLARFVDPVTKKYDFAGLAKVATIVTTNLNKVVDINKYPVWQTELSNFKHRPLGIGVQGLADTFHLLGLAFEDQEALDLDARIFETIYYAALCQSVELARQEYFKLRAEARKSGTVSVIVDYKKDVIIKNGEPIIYCRPIYSNFTEETLPTTAGAYVTYKGSPLSEGKLQFDLWNEDQKYMEDKIEAYLANFRERVLIPSFKQIDGMNKLQNIKRHYYDPSKSPYDWNTLRAKLAKFGARNSLLLSLMPTAGTSQILGLNECFEPYTENIYVRKTMAGEFEVVNPHLQTALSEMGLWNDSVAKNIRINQGSVAGLVGVDDHFKARFATAYEISQKVIIDHAVVRSPFICQTQSMNLFMKNPTIAKVSAMHFYGWSRGLKTGMYYLRGLAAAKPFEFNFTREEIERFKLSGSNPNPSPTTVKSEDEICLACSG